MPDWKDEVLEVLGEVRREGVRRPNLAELEHLRTGGIEPESEERLRELLQDAEENGGTATTLLQILRALEEHVSGEHDRKRKALLLEESNDWDFWDSTSWKK